MSTIEKNSCNCMLLLLALFIIRTAMAQSPAAAPSGPPKVIPAASPAPSAPAPVLSPPAPAVPVLAPTASGPPNIMKILRKAGQYRTLLRLLTSTQLGNQINGELRDPSNGMTIFAPTDSAFAALPAGTINKLEPADQVALVQFHVVTTYYSPAQFQAASNPLHTKAGDVGPYGYPLNVTTNGTAALLSSGINNDTVTSPFYNDNQLAVYQINKVLLPLGLFGPKAPPASPAPSPASPKKERSSSSSVNESPADTSSDVGLRENVVVALVAATIAAFWS